jgi:hypothetical protein
MSSEVAKERAIARGREEERAVEERGWTPAKERAHAASYVPFRSERCQEPRSPASASHGPKAPGDAVVGTPFFHERAPIRAACVARWALKIVSCHISTSPAQRENNNNNTALKLNRCRRLWRWGNGGRRLPLRKTSGIALGLGFAVG